jgi:hypothetical protein
MTQPVAGDRRPYPGRELVARQLRPAGLVLEAVQFHMGDAQTPRKCGSHGRFAGARIAHHRHRPHSTTLRVGANNLPDRDRRPLTQRHVQAALAINRSPQQRPISAAGPDRRTASCTAQPRAVEPPTAGRSRRLTASPACGASAGWGRSRRVAVAWPFVDSVREHPREPLWTVERSGSASGEPRSTCGRRVATRRHADAELR